MAGPLDLLGCPRGRTHQQRGRTSHPACRPVAQGEFRHAVREWCTVCQCHADGRGDLPDARPGPARLPGRGLHREHGRPCRPPAPPRLRLIPGCLQATPDVAGPVTWCAFPTDPRERLRPTRVSRSRTRSSKRTIVARSSTTSACKVATKGGITQQNVHRNPPGTLPPP